MNANLMMFVFNHPADFPESEYGGMWVVRARNAREAGSLAWEQRADSGNIESRHYEMAAEAGKCFMLKSFPDDLPCVVDHFIT